MQRKVIHTSRAPAPNGAYSQAIAMGRTVHLSGQLGIVPETGELADGFAAQCHQMFRNLSAVCEAAGGELAQIVKVTIFMVDLAQFAELNSIMGEYMRAPFPARATVQVAALPKGGLVEADAVLMLD